MYDQHLNMILGDVEEVVTTVEIDDETYEEIVCVSIFLCYMFHQFLQGLSLISKFAHYSFIERVAKFS